MTTPEYAEFEDYPDNTLYPDNQDEDDDDYPLTGEDPEFQPAPAGGDRLESPQPASPDAPSPPSVDPDRSEDVPLTSEPEPEERQYAPPNPPERAAEGGAPEPQPQVKSHLAFFVFILCFIISFDLS